VLDAPDVDALVGRSGFLDAFALRSDYPEGPSASDGSFTESEWHDLTVAS